MIAHRLQTILTADNLLYLASQDNVEHGSKGTDDYEQIINKLMRTNYAHQVDDLKNQEEAKGNQLINEDDEEIKNKSLSKVEDEE